MSKDRRLTDYTRNQQLQLPFHPINVMGVDLEEMTMEQLDSWFGDGVTVTSNRRKVCRKLLTAFQFDRCFYCYRKLRGIGSARQRTIDHIVPIVKNGPDRYSNIVAACKLCNDFKGRNYVGDFVSTDFFQEQWATRHTVGVMVDGSLNDLSRLISPEELSPWFVDLRYPELFS